MAYLRRNRKRTQLHQVGKDKQKKTTEKAMSVNSSSSLNATFILPYYMVCLKSMSSNAIYIAYTLTNLLFLVPLYILILYMGFQQRRRQQTMSHSNFFTYHTVMMEILVFLDHSSILWAYSPSVRCCHCWGCMHTVLFSLDRLFHLLTCVERYLAVIHPVTYIRLRETGWVRIRNISILCVWLLCFGWMGISQLYLPDFPASPLICMLGVSVVVISFCCLSVRHVVRHPGLGDGGRDKEQVDQSKQWAFHIIVAIMGALLLRCVGLLFSFGFSYLQSITKEDFCVLLATGIFLTAPSSLVLPLLFLHKMGKLACCRHKTESG